MLNIFCEIKIICDIDIWHSFIYDIYYQHFVVFVNDFKLKQLCFVYVVIEIQFNLHNILFNVEHILYILQVLTTTIHTLTHYAQCCNYISKFG